MKKIYLNEYTFILHKYPAEMVVSEEDFTKLESEEIEINDIINNYEIDYYGHSTPIYDESNIDSYEYCGCVEDEEDKAKLKELKKLIDA